MKLGQSTLFSLAVTATGLMLGCTQRAPYSTVSSGGIAEPANKAAADAHAKAIFTDQSRDETRNLVGEKFRVKDSALLKGTLNCVGDDVNQLLTVPDDAIKTANGAGAASPGKERVVPFGLVAAGTSIIEAKKAELYDPDAEGRESSASPEATVNYLNAATLVAEVVAHNADVSTPNSKAYCRTAEAAKDLIIRCVPNVAEDSLKAVIGGKTIPEKMAEKCNEGASDAEKDLNSRVALASFLSSWTFLKSER
ncbi:MAG: hypothetical protein RJB13_201 [Pseudomonadota bacterium]